MKVLNILTFITLLLSYTAVSAQTKDVTLLNSIYNPGVLKQIDSVLKVKAGQVAPEFTLQSITGKHVSLADFKGTKNVVLSFVPAAFTPVCSDQWPGYNITKKLFDDHDAVLLGITVDNIPSLYAWVNQMGDLWFEVLSDFWPHGGVAKQYGVLRSDGTADRALIFIDKNGIVRDAVVTDINIRPPLENIVASLDLMVQ